MRKELICVVKNNLKSLVIHIIINFLSIIIFISFGGFLTAKWHTEEAAIRHHNYIMTLSITWIIVAFFIYFLLSIKFLANLKSIYKNLLSTILIVIIGILIWVIALSHGINVSNGYLLNSKPWQLYAIYNMYSSLFLDESGINNQYLFLLFSFLPMVSMALRLLLKQGVAKDK